MFSWKKIWPSSFNGANQEKSLYEIGKTDDESATESNVKLKPDPVEKIDYFGRFKSTTLQNEFILDCLEQKSPILFSVVTVIIMLWLGTDIYYSYSYFPKTFGYSIITCLSASLLVVACGMALRILAFSITPSERKTIQHSRFQIAFLLTLNIILALGILEAVLYGVVACIPHEFSASMHSAHPPPPAPPLPPHPPSLINSTMSLTPPMPPPLPGDVNNQTYSMSYNLQDCPPTLISPYFKLVLVTVPCLLMVILYEPRLYLIFGFILDLVGLLIALFSRSKSVDACLPVIITACVFLCLFYDLHLQRTKAFLNTRHLKEMLSERDRNEDVKHATEMRHMIGNIAHDLKTPLSSFITGIDVIKDIIVTTQGKIDSSSCTLESITEAFSNIQTSLASIRNTNTFMLMTINRCLDYTKASKGMKLVPKNETISLSETIQFPIHCMSHIQERIGIKMLPMSEEICSHIITDKQWLQENILCLLSNAVKYSSGVGVVTIAVFLVDKKPESQTTKELHDPENRSISLRGMSPNGSITVKNQANTCDLISPRSQASSTNQVSGAPSPSVTIREGSNHDPRSSTHLNLINPDHIEKNKPNEMKKLPSRISLKEILNQQYLQFEIEDNGIGISEEAMKSLFNPFKQAQRLAGGTGLGLYSLAKRVEALKGSYGVKKRKDGGKGSLFWFAIPYRPDAEAAAAIKILTESQLTPVGMIRQYSNGITAPVSKPSSPAPQFSRQSSANRTPLRSNSRTLVLPVKNSLPNTPKTGTPPNEKSEGFILLVDDAPSIIKMTTMMLKRQGYSITTAENGAIALQKLEEKWRTTGKGFDLILMDLQMPVMDGLEATRRIREMETAGRDWMQPNSNWKDKGMVSVFDDRHQLIFGVSANSDHETMKEALDAGIDDFMGKPFTADNFTDTFMKYMICPAPSKTTSNNTIKFLTGTNNQLTASTKVSSINSGQTNSTISLQKTNSNYSLMNNSRDDGKAWVVTDVISKVEDTDDNSIL